MRKKLMGEEISRPAGEAADTPRTLAIDIGGSGLKMLVLDAAGAPISERERAMGDICKKGDVCLPQVDPETGERY